MRVESEVGRGSTFAASCELVLVFDDEEALLMMTSLALESFGYRVLLAADGAEAIALFSEHRADIAVVVTDMNMPVTDGFSVIRKIREITPDVRVIAASGLGPPTAAQVPTAALRG